MKDRVYNFFHLICEYGFYGLLFFLPISISILESFAGLILFGFIGYKIIKPDLRYIKLWPNVCLYLFLSFCALSMFNSSIYLNKSLHAFFSKWVQYVLICIIVQDVACDQRIFKRGMALFLSSAFLVILSGFSQYIFGIEFLRNKAIIYTNQGRMAMTSCFNNYNAFGAYLVVVLSSALSQMIAPNIHRLKAYSLLILSLLAVPAIFFSLSRGSWVAFSVSFVMAVVFSGNRFIRLVPVIFEMACALSFSIFRERLLFVFKLGGDADRFLYWKAAWHMIIDHPFLGMGIGTFMSNFSKYQPAVHFTSYAHNCYLQICAETGIFSLSIFLILVGLVLYNGFKKFFYTQDFLLLGLLVGLVGFLVHSFFEVHLYSMQLAVLFWVWIGMVMARLRCTG